MKPQERLRKFYVDKIGKREKITFLGTFIIGMFAHFFILANVLNNHDNIRFTPFRAGADLPSGRWVLYLVNDKWHKIWGVYNLTFFNGLLAILLISISACILVNMYDVKSMLNCVLIGGIIITFPSIVSLMFFSFTAPYYGLAICLATMAVYLYKRYKYGFVLSILCIAVSMGIYQAYLPWTIALFVLLLLITCIREKWSVYITFIKGIRCVGAILAGVLGYFSIVKFLLWKEKVVLDTYQGIDSMGHINLKEIPQIIKRIIKNCLFLYKANYYSITTTKIVRYAVCALIVGTLIFVVSYICMNRKNISNVISVLLLGFLLIVAADSIEIMCPDSDIYCLMVYGMSVLFLTPILLTELYPVKLSKILSRIKECGDWIIFVGAMLLVINFIWQANGNYMSGYWTTEQTVSYFETLVTRIKSAAGYSDEYPVAFIGENYEDKSFSNTWQNTPFWYGGHTSILINRYSRDWFMSNYLGYSYEPVSDEVQKKLEMETKDMPSYPDSGSIKVIDGVIVVKRG